MFFGTTAAANETWLTQSSECLETLDGFNEGREWAQYRITQDEVRVLVQSGGEDWVFVELACEPGGGLAEGPRRKLPQRVTGDGAVPAAMLARDDLSAERLERLAQRARQHADLGRSVLIELAASQDVDMPVSNAVAAILGGRVTIDAAIEGLLTRPFKAEE